MKRIDSIINACMRNLKLGLVTLLGVFTLGVNADGQEQDHAYRIEVRIDGISDSIGFLGYHYGNQKYIRDTARVENSTLTFSGDKKLATGVYFVYTPKIFMELIANDQEFAIQTDTSDLLGNFRVQGSPENQLFGQFKAFMSSTQKNYKILTSQLSEAANRDDSMALSRQMEDLNAELKDFKNALIDNNPGTFVAKVLKMNEKIKVPDTITDPADRYYYYRSHFFDNIDFSPGQWKSVIPHYAFDDMSLADAFWAVKIIMSGRQWRCADQVRLRDTYR